MTPTIAKCGQRDCPNPHPVRPWVERAERRPVEKWQPEWLRRLQPKDMTGAAR